MSYLIAIAGPSCAGKTYLAHYLKSLAGASLEILGLDAYYKDFSALPFAERAKLNFDEPDAFDLPLLLHDLTILKSGGAVERPVYDFTSHARTKSTVHVEPAPIIVVEGIMALHFKELLPLFDLKVYIDAREDVRFRRRLERDQKERGRTPASIIYQFNHVVVPMQRRWIDPTKPLADLRLVNDENNGPLPMADPLINRLKGMI